MSHSEAERNHQAEWVTSYTVQTQALEHWHEHAGKQSVGLAGGDSTVYTLDAAKTACKAAGTVCKAITCASVTSCTLRASEVLSDSDSGEVTLVWAAGSRGAWTEVGQFAGNSDSNTKVSAVFPAPVKARHVRILPRLYASAPSMRAGVLECTGVGSPRCNAGGTCASRSAARARTPSCSDSSRPHAGRYDHVHERGAGHARPCR